jgi:predicted component of type VI protein secretion system
MCGCGEALRAGVAEATGGAVPMSARLGRQGAFCAAAPDRCASGASGREAVILTLRVLSSAEGGDFTPLVARFDAAGGLIGRADSARLKLADPKRTVSRFHAHVSFADGRFYIEDMGSPNPIAVNSRTLQSGQRVELNPGDRLQIAHYVVGVEIGDAQPALAEEEVSWENSVDAEERTRLVVDRGFVAAGGGPPTSSAELWQAFEEGAKVQLELPQGLRPEVMRTLGAVVRGAVSALRKQLGLRMLVRREGDGDMGAIRAKNNNPLKFALDDARAITALLKPPLPTFLAGPAAVDETSAELEAHMRATMFAMRAAAQQLLAKVDPAALEKRLAGGVFDSLMPARRKAALWDLFAEQMRDIAGGQGGLDESFTRAFVAAYDHEMARLRRPGTLAQAHSAHAQPQPQPQSQPQSQPH